MSQAQLTRIKVIGIILFLLFTSVNLIYLPANNLNPDEAYYWEWSRHLALGYFDEAPLIAYLDRFFAVMGGNNEFALRLPAWLTWIFLNLFIFKFARIVYKDEQAAYLAMLMALFNPFFLACSHTITPEVLLLLFSLPLWFFLYRAIEAEIPPAWYGAGIFLGLALLAKTEALLIPFSVLVLLLMRPSKWKLFARKELYLGAAISLILFSPVLYWNWQHNWVTFGWQFHHAFQPALNRINLRGIFIRQVGIFSLLLLPLIYYTFKRLVTFRKSTSDDYFLIGSYLPSLLFYVYTGLTSPGETNWTAAAYIPAIIFLAGQFSFRLKFSHRLSQLIASSFILITFLVSGLWVAMFRYPDFFAARPGLKLPINLIGNETADGWSFLGTKVGQILRREFPNPNHPVLIFADSHSLASELAYYVKRPINVYTTRQARRSQFDYWMAATVQKENRRSGLLVLAGPLPDDAATYFKETALVDQVPIRRFNRLIRTFYIYRFQQLNAPELLKMSAEKPLQYPGRFRD